MPRIQRLRTEENIYVGGAINEQETMDDVINMGITHIISLTKECDMRFIDNEIVVLHLYVPDDGHKKGSWFWDTCTRFASWVLHPANNGKNHLLIHCAAGRNRSVSVAFKLLLELGYTDTKAREILVKHYSNDLGKRDPNFPPLKDVRYWPAGKRRWWVLRSMGSKLKRP